jgi:alpha-D-ribose 1-methylphosphonate 5-triphosphate synthase subunit PhnH
MIMDQPLAAGFTDAVLDSQGAFRRILDALSHPGRIERLGGTLTPPPGLLPAAAALLLTLADYETPLWLAPSLGAPVADWLRFHTAAPVVQNPAEVRFAVLTCAPDEPGLGDYAAGDDLYPDRSATVIVQCAGLECGRPVTLAGPGILETCAIAPAGLPPDFWHQLARNNRLYPRGVDVVLAAGDGIIGLPRSLRLEASSEAI